MNREDVILKIILFAVLISGPCARSSAGGWERELFFGLNLSGGNSDVLAGNLNLDAKKGDRARLDFSASYGRSGGERNLDRSSGSARYMWNFDRGLFAGLGLGAARDTVAGVDYRFILSPSAGKRIISSEAADLSVEAGPAYVRESILEEEDSYLGFRFFELFERKLVEGSRLRQSFEYTFESGDDYLIGFELGAVSALTSSLNLRAALELDYDSSPARDREKYDIALVASLGFSF